MLSLLTQMPVYAWLCRSNGVNPVDPNPKFNEQIKAAVAKAGAKGVITMCEAGGTLKPSTNFPEGGLDTALRARARGARASMGTLRGALRSRLWALPHGCVLCASESAAGVRGHRLGSSPGCCQYSGEEFGMRRSYLRISEVLNGMLTGALQASPAARSRRLTAS